MEPNLEYKYDEYEEDFYEEAGNDKNKPSLSVEYQLQTENPQNPSVKMPTQ